MVNPDGFDRRRRENASGQDLNRDFPNDLAGKSGFTQPETRAIADFVRKELTRNDATLEASLEYHCCIGGLIHPWAYSPEPLEPLALERHRQVGRKVQSLFGYASGTVREIVGYTAVGGSDDYYFETYGRRAFSFEGAEGVEAQKLPKHVQLWQGIFELVLADRDGADAAGDDAGGEATPSDDLFLAVADGAAADAPKLFAAAPDTVDAVTLCLGERGGCLARAAKVRTKRVRSSGGRAYFEALTTPKLGAEGLVTIFATKGAAKPDAATPFVSVKLERR
jgi:hypothetical protein